MISDLLTRYATISFLKLYIHNYYSCAGPICIFPAQYRKKLRVDWAEI